MDGFKRLCDGAMAQRNQLALHDGLVSSGHQACAGTFYEPSPSSSSRPLSQEDPDYEKHFEGYLALSENKAARKQATNKADPPFNAPRKMLADSAASK